MIRFAVALAALSCSSAALVEPAPECIADQYVGPANVCAVVCAPPGYELAYPDTADVCGDVSECVFLYAGDVAVVVRSPNRDALPVERVWFEVIECEEWWR